MKRLLLLEDDIEVGDLYAGFLGEYEVSRASTVKGALAHLYGEKKFDAAVIDFWLVEETAVPILEALKFDFSSLPVILISGGNQSFSPELTEAFASVTQQNLFLHKPIRRSDLLSALETVMSEQ